MIFVSSPYSNPDPFLQRNNFLLVEEFVAKQIKEHNLIVFSPIVYAHEMAIRHRLGTDAFFWQTFNTEMLRWSECLFSLQLPGWKESKGVALEFKLAKILNIPIVEFDANGNNLTELRAKFQVS
jgi:hypothetical protein